MTEQDIESLRREIQELELDTKRNFERLEDFFKKLDPNLYNKNDLPIFRWSKKKW